MNQAKKDLETLEEIAGDLLGANPSVSEGVFKNTYLQMLIEKPPKEFNDAWLLLARSPYVEVDVVSKDGTKLYSVPRLREPTVPLKDASLANVMQVGIDKASLHQSFGTAYLKKALPGILELSPGASAETVRRWNEILVRYDLTEEFSSGVQEDADGNVDDDSAVVNDDW